MSGHSKWAQIKRQKGVNDAARSAIFAKLARRITVESKKAKGDVSAPSLRAAIDAAKAANMPKENIERAVAKGSASDAASLESVVYETYGPGGAAIIIDVLTDNRNRTSAEIKHLLSENGLSLASPGSALWAFEKTAGGFQPKSAIKLSETDDAALLQTMEQIDAHDDVQEVYTNAE
ncbi:YebC/PmpR family DNA-binding transcriptional regulator [Candidatus Uhrbacteria bacterium]|nr:YebC/PmpR family DNA-binding transcriptional regulator [Candidatus Uhrbacteria bacterium]